MDLRTTQEPHIKPETSQDTKTATEAEIFMEKACIFFSVQHQPSSQTNPYVLTSPSSLPYHFHNKEAA